MVSALIVLFKLLTAHALCDFTLQTEAMAKGKNRNRASENVPPGQKPAMCWPYWLTAHALIQAGGVWLVTDRPLFALVELVTHWVIDFMKCENWTNPHQDQLLHLVVLLGFVGEIWSGYL